MKINDRRSNRALHLKRLFLPINEFDLTAFSVQPRPMRLAQVATPGNPLRSARLERKGAAPC